MRVTVTQVDRELFKALHGADEEEAANIDSALWFVEEVELIAAHREQAERQALERAAKGWQPIETAPKDGNVVMLFAREVHATAPVRVVGFYHPDNGWVAMGWTSPPTELVPTLWQPLPPFPGTER